MIINDLFNNKKTAVAEGSKMARVDKSAKAPKPKNQQEYDAVEKYRKDLAQSYNKEPNFGIKDDEEENKWWIDYDLDEGVAEGSLEEVSQQTLQSYRKKASAQKRAADDVVSGDADDETWKKNVSLSAKRRQGIDAANKRLGVAEGSLEEVDRRGFLKGVGAAAVAGATGGANADETDRAMTMMMILYYTCQNPPQNNNSFKPSDQVCQETGNLLRQFKNTYKDGATILQGAYSGVYEQLEKMIDGAIKGTGPVPQLLMAMVKDVSLQQKTLRNFKNTYLAFNESVNQGMAENMADDMAAMAQKKFPTAYISKNGQEVQKPENWGKRYTPPPAAPADLEKQQRDLTAKYPNIDELVRRAELNRDPDYEMADGEAYYAARDAEQNYQKLRQIQRVIQGLNESLNRSHLP